jgi:hypothetical protein
VPGAPVSRREQSLHTDLRGQQTLHLGAAWGNRSAILSSPRARAAGAVCSARA